MKGKVTSLFPYFSLVMSADSAKYCLRLKKSELCYDDFTMLQDQIEVEQSYFTLMTDISKCFLINI